MFTRAGLAVLTTAAVIATAAGSHADPVKTLEGDFAGIQRVLHFTPGQLRSALCKRLDQGHTIDFPFGLLGLRGAARSETGIDAPPADTVLGHRLGDEVNNAEPHAWTPAPAADPVGLSRTPNGNPGSTHGGRRPKPEPAHPLGLAQNTTELGTHLIGQDDGPAPWPDDPTSLLSIVSTLTEMLAPHTDRVQVAPPAPTPATPPSPSVVQAPTRIVGAFHRAPGLPSPLQRTTSAGKPGQAGSADAGHKGRSAR